MNMDNTPGGAERVAEAPAWRPAYETSSRRYRRFVLFMLMLVYAFNYLDRQIIAVLAGPIQQDLGLNDTQMGLLGGLAFALLYTTLSIPLAVLADRSNRSWVITISLAAWSGFTAISGMVTSFWQMFLARVGVGVGEAGGVAPSYAIISEYFPPNERARALAIYSLGLPFGAAAGFLLGGWIAEAVDWRTAFYVVGIAGLLLAPIFRLAVKEPSMPQAKAAGKPPVSAGFRQLGAKSSFWLMAAGGSFGCIAGYGYLFWFPLMVQRSYGLSLAEAGQWTGVLVLIGGTLGLLTGGWLTDHLGKRDPNAYARIPGYFYIVASLLYIPALLSGTATIAFLAIIIPYAFALSWLSPILAATQALVSRDMRATAPACLLLFTNLAGLGLGSSVIGAISDALQPSLGGDSLRYAMLYIAPCYLVGGIFFLLAARRLADQRWD